MFVIAVSSVKMSLVKSPVVPGRSLSEGMTGSVELCLDIEHVCTCMYVCRYVCMYVCMCVHVRVYLCI